MDDILINSFNKDFRFFKVINFQFLEIIKDYEHFPEFLAIYSDNLLTEGLKGKIERQEEFINIIKFFISCVLQKDIFIGFYQFYLGYRLLNHSSFDSLLEEAVISTLIEACGFSNVSKL